MAKVQDIICCLRATNDDERGVCATTILTALNPEYIPGLFTFSVIILLVDIDTSFSHQFQVNFISPSQETLVHIDDNTPIIHKSSNLPLQYQGLNVAMDWNNVDLKVSGEYKIEISIDGEIVGNKHIYVKGKNEP